MDIIRAQESNTQLHEQFNKQVDLKKYMSDSASGI